jgi:agmatinase
VVELAPAYDHAELTTVAVSHVAYELISLMALAPAETVAAQSTAEHSIAEVPA